MGSGLRVCAPNEANPQNCLPTHEKGTLTQATWIKLRQGACYPPWLQANGFRINAHPSEVGYFVAGSMASSITRAAIRRCLSTGTLHTVKHQLRERSLDGANCFTRARA